MRKVSPETTPIHEFNVEHLHPPSEVDDAGSPKDCADTSCDCVHHLVGLDGTLEIKFFKVHKSSQNKDICPKFCFLPNIKSQIKFLA